MNTGTTIAIAAGLFLVTGLFTKSQALQSLVFYPHSLKGIRFDGVTPVMTLGLAVQNTASQSFTLRSFAGELYANKYLIGNVASFVPQTILPNSQTVIFIDARLSLLGIVSDIINAINNHTFNQELDLDSTANIDNLQVPVKLNFKFGK